MVSATALVVSNMIGTGIFTTTGFLAGDLGSASLVLWIWVVGAVCALVGAFCYSELGINLPSSGGEYVYLTRAFGPTWGFMTGWVSFFAGFSAPIAAAALAFSDYLGQFFPALRGKRARVSVRAIGHSPSAGASSRVRAGAALHHSEHPRRAARRAGAECADRRESADAGRFHRAGVHHRPRRLAAFLDARRAHVHESIPAQFAISLFCIYVAYSGWNAATYVAEELRHPSRTLPMALAVGTALVAALYLGLNVVFIYAAPLEDLKGETAVGAFAASRLFGPQVAGIFAALMALSLMATVNAMVTIGPRVYYAMAKNGAFLAAAAKVHPSWHTPVAAIVAQGVCTMLMTLTPFPQLVIYIGFTLNFFAVMSVAALLMFRRRAGWQKLRVVSFGYPLFPVVFHPGRRVDDHPRRAIQAHRFRWRQQ